MYNEHAVKALFSGKTLCSSSPGYSEMLSLESPENTWITVFEKLKH
jgi:hypothetical protein